LDQVQERILIAIDGLRVVGDTENRAPPPRCRIRKHTIRRKQAIERNTRGRAIIPSDVTANTQDEARRESKYQTGCPTCWPQG